MLPKDTVTQGGEPQGNDSSQTLALGWTGLELSAVLPSGSRSPSQWGSPGPRPGYRPGRWLLRGTLAASPLPPLP